MEVVDLSAATLAGKRNAYTNAFTWDAAHVRAYKLSSCGAQQRTERVQAVQLGSFV